MTGRGVKRAAMSALAAVCALAGCATGPATVTAYEGPPHARAEDAVIAPSLVYLARMIRVRVTSIDGREFDPTHATEFRVTPGRHVLVLQVVQEVLHPLTPVWTEPEATVAFVAVAGHTYVPNAAVFKDHAVGRLDDMGLDYPERCLPARRNLRNGAGNETPEQATACAPKVVPDEQGPADAPPARPGS